MLTLLCLGGVGVGYVLYDQATRPDRSAPDVVVDNYLRALLVDRNDTQTTLYACSDESGLSEIRAFAADIQAREKEHSIDIAVSWGSLDVQPDGGQAWVTTEISRTIRDGSERDLSTWRFVVVEDDGWRVCGARRIS